MTAQPEVRENVAEHRFEIWIDDRFGGRGLGSVLIREALNSVRARGAQVLPHRPFVKRFIQKHPDYLDLVPPAQRAAFGLPETATV